MLATLNYITVPTLQIRPDEQTTGYRQAGFKLHTCRASKFKLMSR